jgi:hypothetical protein
MIYFYNYLLILMDGKYLYYIYWLRIFEREKYHKFIVINEKCNKYE